MPREWRRVPGTRNWVLVEVDSGAPVRQVAVRDPYFNEQPGTKYVVSGDGHGDAPPLASLSEAQAAAEASLP